MAISPTTDELLASTELESSVAESYDLDNPDLFINRELSLLEFNSRVLEEAQDERNPILERAKFLAIYSSNMDEFFMIRVAGLMQQITAKVNKVPADGLTPTEQLRNIRKKVRANLKILNHCFDDIKAKLAQAGVHLHAYDELTEDQQEGADEYFNNEIFPVLTPLAFDPGRPFPHISSLSLNLAVLVRDPDNNLEHFARIKVPNTLPRLVPVARTKDDTHRTYRFIWLEDLIAHNLPHLFPGYEIEQTYSFRITRNADLTIEADEASDLLEVIEATVRRRRFGFVVRLTVEKDTSDAIRQLLSQNLDIEAEATFESSSPLGLSGLMRLMALDRPDLKDPPYVSVVHPRFHKIDARSEVFDVIKQGDVLLHHPYDSFISVIDFLRAAAKDPHVIAIKQTLYRAGKNSPVVDALMEARENGKQVSALVELKARFDEESNIGWAKTLEREGVHVIYGFMSLKTHSKICLVIRREADNIRRYVHLGTGNYNAITANIYTDLGLFTAKPEFGADASDLFNALTGYSKKTDYKKFLVAPASLRPKFAELIDREIRWAEQGQEAKLIFKMNALIDPAFTKQLYRASQAGVKIELYVRGVCGLRPGIPNLSDNIKVVSLVGRFLEHTRIYYFHNGGKPDIFLGSADLMPRNLDRRIETLFPIEDIDLKQQLIELLDIVAADEANARLLLSDGSYVRVASPTEDKMKNNSQAIFMDKAKNR